MKSIKYILSVITLIASGVFIYYHRDKIHLLLTISIQDIIILLFLGFVSFLPIAFQFNSLMKMFGVTLTFTEWFGLTTANTMYNYYMPARGGLIIRALYLKKKYNFSYAKYLSLTSGAYILNMIVASLSSLFWSLTYYFTHDIIYTSII